MVNIGEKIEVKKYILYAVIFLLQIVTVLYWSTQKENYNIDELYSMESAYTYANPPEYGQYIYKDPEFAFHKWVSNSVYRRRLVVTQEDTIFKLPFSEIFMKMVKGRNFNGLLNMSESVFGYDFITVRPALAINILFFVVGELFLLLLLKRLGISDNSRVLSITMFGFSVLMLSAVNYVRFYSIAIMMAMIIFNLIYTAWKDERLGIFIIALIGAFIIAYFSYRDTELTIPYFGALLLFFMIALIIKKRWKKVLVIISFFAIGMVYMGTTTEYLSTLLNPASNKDTEVSKGIAENIRNISIGAIWRNVRLIFNYVFSHYFTSVSLVMVMLVVITVGLLVRYERETKESIGIKSFVFEIKSLNVVLFMVWAIILVIMQGMGHGTGLCYLVFAILMVYVAYKRLGLHFNLKAVLTGNESGFICMLACTVLLYALFSAMGGLKNWRYCFPVIIMVPIILWYVADKAINDHISAQVQKSVYAIITVFVIVNAVTPFITRNIEYIYEDDRELKEVLYDYADMPVVMISRDLKDGAGTIDDHELYDCVWQMSDEAKIYCVDYDWYHYEDVDYPDDFILWSNLNKDLTWIIEELKQNGYEVDKLGVNHVSRVYHCVR